MGLINESDSNISIVSNEHNKVNNNENNNENDEKLENES